MGMDQAEDLFGKDDLKLILERDKGKFRGELHCMPLGTIKIP